MYIICGLGNPGKRYEKTRHNVGFMAIDKLAGRLNISVNKLKHNALIGEGRVGTKKVILMKPQTFMNLSGETIRSACDFYKVDPENILVIYDDIDFDAGVLKIRQKGSAGSHNGMKSIVSHLGTTEFPRVRIGVSKPKNGGDLVDFVLGRPDKDEEKLIEEVLDKAADAVISVVEDGVDIAMNRFNSR